MHWGRQTVFQYRLYGLNCYFIMSILVCWTAIQKYQQQGGLINKKVTSQLWRLKVQDQDVNRFGFP